MAVAFVDLSPTRFYSSTDGFAALEGAFRTAPRRYPTFGQGQLWWAAAVIVTRHCGCGNEPSIIGFALVVYTIARYAGKAHHPSSLRYSTAFNNKDSSSKKFPKPTLKVDKVS